MFSAVSKEPGRYSRKACKQLATELSDDLLSRSIVLFGAFAERGQLSSSELADMLGVRTDQIGGLLLGPLSRHARALELDLPSEVTKSDEGRRAWRDQAGNATRPTTHMARSKRGRAA